MGNRLFKAVSFLLGAVEASDFVALHWHGFAWDAGEVLDEANHGSGALRVELFVIGGLNGLESTNAILLCDGEGVFSDILFQIVP